MFNLIKNEYLKIFYKKSTYILLVVLILPIIAMPIITRFVDSQDYYYYESYDQLIQWCQESNDRPGVEMYKKARDLGIDEKAFCDYESDWRIDALNEAYYTYWDTGYNEDSDFIESSVSVSKEQRSKFRQFFDGFIKTIKDDDWKANYKLRIEAADYEAELYDYDSDTTEGLKENYQYLIDHDIKPCSGNWKEKVVYTYCNNKKTYEDMKSAKDAGEYYDPQQFDTVESSYLISKYRLENNVEHIIYEDKENESMDNDKYIFTGDFYNNIKNGIGFLTIIMIIGIIIAGNSISQEYSQGTIKFLLINPVRRNKIYWSKYITVISFTFILTLLSFLAGLLMSLIVYGPEQFNTMLLLVKDGQLVQKSALLFMMLRYLVEYVSIAIPITMAFCISSFFRNSALAIAISFVINIIGSSVCGIASLFKLDFFRYTIFNTQDLLSVIDGNSVFFNTTVTFAIVVDAIYVFLFLLIGHDAFTKKDI